MEKESLKKHLLSIEKDRLIFSNKSLFENGIGMFKVVARQDTLYMIKSWEYDHNSLYDFLLELYFSMFARAKIGSFHWLYGPKMIWEDFVINRMDWLFDNILKIDSYNENILFDFPHRYSFRSKNEVLSENILRALIDAKSFKRAYITRKDALMSVIIEEKNHYIYYNWHDAN